MPRTTRRVPSGRRAYDYPIPDNATWSQIESKLRLSQPMSNEKRSFLLGVTIAYAIVGTGVRQSLTILKIKRELGVWRKQTERLRKLVWQTEIGAKARTSGNARRTRLTRRVLERQYLAFDQRSFKRIEAYPWDQLAFLAQSLDAAMAVCDYTLQELSFTGEAEFDEAIAWRIWVATLIHIVHEIDIEVGRTGSQDTLRRPRASFVSFVQALQGTLPENMRLRKSRETLRKGIREAFTLTSRFSRAELIGLLFVRLLFDRLPSGTALGAQLKKLRAVVATHNKRARREPKHIEKII